MYFRIQEILAAVNPYFMFMVNFYWLLYLIPGYAAYLFLSGKFNEKDTSLVKSFVFSFFYSALLVLPFNILAYFVEINAWIPTIYFLLLIAFGSYFIWKKQGQEIISRIKSFKFKAFFQDERNILAITVGVLLILDFTMFQFIKAFSLFMFDAWAHISKVNFMMGNGLSIKDPYFLMEGKNVIQSNFSSNLLHTVTLIPARLLSLFGVKTYHVWLYSVSIFRLFTYGAVYYFIKKVTGHKHFAIFVFLVYFFTTFATMNEGLVQYPTRVAFVFFLITTTLFVDLVSVKDNKDFSILFPVYILGIISVSFLHQVQSALMVLFLGGLAFFLWIFREINFRSFWKLSLPLMLALPTSIFTVFVSKYMPRNVYELGNGDLYRISTNFYMLKFQDQVLSATFLAIIFGILVSSIFITNKKLKLFLYFSLLFNTLLLYTPIFALVNKAIPTWGIVRQDYYVVIINWIFLILPIFYFGAKLIAKEESKIQFVAVATAILLLSMTAQKDVKYFYDVSIWNQGTVLSANQLISFGKYIKPGKIILANDSISFAIPGVMNNYVAGYDDSRTTDSVNTTQRWIDQQSFLTDFKQSIADKRKILDKYDISYVILNHEERKSFGQMTDLMKLKEITKTNAYSVYEKQ